MTTVFRSRCLETEHSLNIENEIELTILYTIETIATLEHILETEI